MLNKVLQEMSTGGVHSRADLARRLDINEGLLSQMMEDLAHKGYLATLKTPSDCGGCSGCGGDKACTGCIPSEATALRSWVLTAKGLDAAKRTRNKVAPR